ARVDEMATDTVSAEVLYPSLALRLFELEDGELQREAFRRYNDWLAEYCRVSPHRLVGIGTVATYDIDGAVEDARRCHAQGLRGILVWENPHPDLPFSGSFYDPLWSVCEELRLPVSIHILTGFASSRELYRDGSRSLPVGLPRYRLSINLK